MPNTVFAGASRDGGAVFRAVDDGSVVWTEAWDGEGWVKSGEPLGAVLRMPPAGPDLLAAAGVPVEGTREGDPAS